MPQPITAAQRRQVQLAPATRNAPAGAKINMTARSRRYLDAIARLDQAGNAMPESTAKALADIRDEYRQQWATEPLGLVGLCYLGRPYEVHTLTLEGDIIRHYKGGEPLPTELEQARPLITCGLYEVVEVYPDRLVCVRPDGTLAELAAQGGAQ
jgi:hypothetical protein